MEVDEPPKRLASPWDARIPPECCSNLSPIFDIPGRRCPRLAQAGGYALPGALFEITESGLTTLDLKEGTPKVYRWEITEVLLLDGSSARAVVYNLPSTRPSVPVPPDLGYLGIDVAGLKDYGHSVSRLLAAAQGTDDAQNVPLFCSGTLMLGEALHGVMCSLGAWFLGDAKAHGLLAGLGDFSRVPARRRADYPW